MQHASNMGNYLRSCSSKYASIEGWHPPPYIYFNYLRYKSCFCNTTIKVANKREVREVQEGATCFCDKKLSKID